MNNSTEQVMKEWQPRQPSPGLRNRIFVTEAKENPQWARRPLDVAGLMRWFVPAMGCFVMVMGMAAHPSMRVPAGALAPIGEQQLAFSTASGNNSVPAKSLEWTLGKPSRSSSNSFVGSDTNTLHQ